MSSSSPGSARPLLSGVAILLATLLLGAALLLGYSRAEILDGSRLSARTVDALDKPPVRDEFVRRLTDQIVAQGAVSAADRASVVSVMTTVVGGEQFRTEFRRAVEEVHRVVLDDSGGALELRLDRAAAIASDALRPTSPELADLAKTRLAGFAVQIAGRRDAVDAVRAANTLKLLALIVPAVALVLFLVGVAVARRKAIGWAWVGVGICAAGVVATAVAVLGRGQVTTNVAAVSRPAVRGVWDSIVGDLRWWGLVVFALGAVLAAVAAVAARGQNRRRAARAIRVDW